jgi:hypothetical protein
MEEKIGGREDIRKGTGERERGNLSVVYNGKQVTLSTPLLEIQID